MAAYYNEHDRKAAATLRELIKRGHIAPGDVDERDIRDVRPDELRPYTQIRVMAARHSMRKESANDRHN